MTADTPTDLLVGIAQLLHDAGVVNWTGVAGVAATAGGLPACTLRQLPSDPVFVVTLFEYAVTANARLTDLVQGVNFRIRSDAGPGRASLVSNQIFLALHAIGRRTLSTGLGITDLQRQSEAQLGPDGNGRHERSVNYYALLNQPSTSRD
jgi:hypothetical protein